MADSRERRSLFGEILDWMLAPLLLLWPMSVALTWLVAQGIANRPYDRDLSERLQVLAQQVAAEQAQVHGPPQVLRDALGRVAATMLRADDEDRLFYQVLGERGEFIAGDPRLRVPDDARSSPVNVPQLRDDTVGDETVRVAYMWLPQTEVGADHGPLVQIAETLDKRSRLATEIIKGVILPQFVILPLAVVLVWFALGRGIRPLRDLQRRIRARESHDLSPIDERDVPEEVAPLVASINDLLQRLDDTIATQRRFLADAAHQLKTPLAGLRMQAELAEREIDAGRGDPQALKHSLHQIALSSQRAAHMVNQLLAMARAEDQALVMRKQRLDLAEIARETVRDFVPKSLERRIDLGYDGPEPGDERCAMPGQPVFVRELVRNLVDNALQYTPPGGSVTARVLPDPFGQVVVLQVEDTGPGIPAAERELVFRPFYRALGTQVDGSGLGLAIVREIAERHDAQVAVEDARHAPPGSAEGPGALFTVRFPRQAT
ncbi:MAG: sensor histidine kinase N-terminal domain-containing protein [Rubrivivax sp.]|jgi:two-component system sensor histidine kinase TctE|nr:sensor histidine kinase N-terminal domain-containing protein [Rubrivivax sp.]